jgi:hypothetical protein
MILVMSGGRVAEYAPPQELLKDEVSTPLTFEHNKVLLLLTTFCHQKSEFYNLCQGAGIV